MSQTRSLHGIRSFLDANSFANRGEIVKSGVNKVYLKTTNKRLIAKYDPAFKARILRQSV